MGKSSPLLFTAVVWALGLTLLVAELAWLGWFLMAPLPNATKVDGQDYYRRWMFLVTALPEVWPDVSYHKSGLGTVLDKLSRLEYLPQRLPVVLAAGLIGVSAAGLGGLLLRALGLVRSLNAAERLALSYVVGTPALGAITLVLGRFGLLGPWPTRVGLLVPILAEGFLLLRDARARPARTSPRRPGSMSALVPWLGITLAVGPFLLLMALGAMLPAMDFDAVEYHLEGPKEYFLAGRIGFLRHNVYTSMPFNVEMLHLLGMVVLGDWWTGALAGQLLVAAHAPFAAGLIALTALRWGSRRAAWFSALVYLTTPWVFRLGVIPYVEGPLGDYHAALFWAVARAWTEPPGSKDRLRFWTLAGWLAGGAMACKYTALISAVLPFGLVALADAARSRSPRLLLAFTLGWAAVMTPWLAKNVADTGNPVYPLGYKVFGGRNWDNAMDRKWADVHGPRPISAGLFKESVVDVAGRSDWQSSLYLALGPLAFLRPGSRRFASAVALYAASIFLSWWFLTHRLDRFWLPILPSLAVLAGLGADWSGRRAWSVLLGFLVTIAVVTNLAYSATGQTAFNEWTEDYRTLRKTVPQIWNPPLARLDATLPDGAKVLMVGQAAVFHFEHPVVYNTVFDDEIYEEVSGGRTPEEVRERLVGLGISYVYIDWPEIERYRSPGNYGFTPFVTPEEVGRLVRGGALVLVETAGTRQELYRVRSLGRP